ncbi:hypothetical protein SBOR_8948 [Sclerotinia borealis F-4128]|uniref:BTB domain-containing protein n=1 Tax=Sclerotinia borealis (strain F-4128) TaxID=1432307 RepID=W9C4L6_SCLBF|nr:hypothetical protein SBOR_8948 [Sclerotinia borealis F-4128]
MDIPPEFDLPQQQTILNALKNICRDYPAGGSVLRELLQNADDAQASEVKFILDESSYEKENLPPKLAQYQGPALLAFNNAEFKKEHFQSLSQVGNSLKMEDGSTTGKFGRGFNSVYNWTDSPSIVSGHLLQILDPHHAWSSGGNGYDFVKYSENPQVKAHMAVYQSLIKKLDQPFSGTIIRIPLRTADQARTSGISDRSITVSEMAQVLETFTESFSTEGLVFMKYVLKISVISTMTGVIEIEVMNSKSVQHNKNRVNNAIVSILENPAQAFDCTFELEVRYQIRQAKTHRRFLLHHSIQGSSMTEEIRKWSKNQKLVPWIAVAIPLLEEDSSNIHGSLFLVMPLPIPINQPAFIHGLFNISPDRARLYKSQDYSSQDQLPAKWNQWLFDSSIPHAWTKLLSHLALSFPPDPSFKYWPHKLDDPNNLSKDVLTHVLSLVRDQSLHVWHTANGYVSADSGLLASGNEPEDLKLALANARIPVVYLPNKLREEAKQLFLGLELEPRTLCKYLDNKNHLVTSWPQATRQQILEYLLLTLGSFKYGKNLALFPFEDGKCRSIHNHLAFVHRDEFEAELFVDEPQHNLDVGQFSQSILHNLQKRLKTSQFHPRIRHRSASDFRDYSLAFVFRKLGIDADMTVLDIDQISFVAKTWTWIQRNSDIFNDSLANLWLLPLANGKYRKLKPRSCCALIPPPGLLGDIVQRLGKDVTAYSPPVILPGAAGLDEVLLASLKNTKAGATLQVRNGEIFHFLLQWFGQSHVAIENTSDKDKIVIIECVARALEKHNEWKYTNDNMLCLQKLPIFQELAWETDGDRWYPTTTWVRIDAFKSTIGVLDGAIPLPQFKDYQFLDAQTTPIRKILGYQKLVCKSKIRLLEDHVIPAWRGLQKCTWSPSSKAQTAELMLQSYYDLSAQAQSGMTNLPIVPTQCIDGSSTSKFSTASALIDPGNEWLKSVFFSDEEVLPADKQYERYGSIFKKFGLRTNLDELFVYERVRKFASSTHSTEDVHIHAINLLRTPCSWSTSKATATKNKQFLNPKWLPATLPDGTTAMVSPNQCRGFEDKLRAGHRLPIVSLTVSYHWKDLLGWNKVLPDDILLAQLGEGIIKDDDAVVNSVLTYIKDNFRINAVSEELKHLRCVLTDKGTFVTAYKAFLSGCTRLGPFLGNIDAGFAKNHADILKAMGVRSKPGVKDILDVQAQIEQSGYPYKDSDIEVLLETMTIASRFPRTSLRGLKVLDRDSVLCPVEDIAYDDAALLSDRIVNKVRFTNSRISKQTADMLRIEPISERMKKGVLQLADDDDDEEDFHQCEAITTSISTTLDRYPIESTFKEYLANADDAKASAVHWMLDSRHHSTDNLLTEEMKDLQGPALLVHNDAVFRDIDFNGFKNVGLGSKREDKSSIGMFGRGSQTMFHFTDNPCLLSGDYLLILDPLQTCLPFNSNWQARKPGVKILLSKLKQLHPNQLVPFQNLWGYDADSDHYDGTIFRFPLRKHASPLREKQELPTINTVHLLLNLYFKEARISLLFLKGVEKLTFKGPDSEELSWSVKKKKSTSDYTVFFAKQMMGPDLIAIEDKWWIYSKMEETPSGEYQSRLRKNLEYGIAALVLSESNRETGSQNTPTPKIFSTLPLPEASDLPVHIHATFSLSGDRNTLITGGESSEAGGSKWNAWLLEEKLADAYFAFLEGLAQEIGTDVFRFWPHRYPRKESRLELLCKSFWEKLPNSSARLFPRRVANSDATNMTISETVFDFMQPTFSKQIAPVLQILQPNLSPYFPAHIFFNIQSTNVAKSIDRPELRKIFKSKRASKCLQEAMIDDPLLISNVLNEAIPVGECSTDELEQLDGCRLLPLADGTLGQLTRIQSPLFPNIPSYYVVTKSELKLFDFAKSLLVLKPQNDSCDRIGRIVKTKKFNVVDLALSHVPELLSIKSQGSRVANEETDKWLKSFWDYWNKSSSSATELLSTKPESFRSLPLFKATCNGVWEYYTISELGNLPAIIDPLDVSHKQLCGCIPGLYKFRPEFMPKSTAVAEMSLINQKAFGRFIDALRILGPDKASIKTLFTQLATRQASIESNQVDLIKLLRELVIEHVNAGNKSALDYLILLPIWPAYMPLSPSEKYIPASGAMYTKQPQLLAPWSKTLPDFIDFEAIGYSGAERCLLALKVISITAEKLIQSFGARDFPSALQATDEGVYTQFLSTLAGIVSIGKRDSSLIKTLSSLTLAADMTGKMHQPHELFDHNDEIFKAAFQDNNKYFLHDCVKAKEYDSLWFNTGLRRRGSNGCFKIHDYMECLRFLELLIQSSDYGTLVSPISTLNKRMKTILLPLIAPSSATHQFDHHDWKCLAAKSVFLVRKDNSREPSYRQENMNRISERSAAIPLAEVILHKYAAICWSNTPFVVLEPTSEILSRVPRHGEPFMIEVWKHLEHMVEISKTISLADIPNFLSDLYEIYDYLQSHLVRSKEYFDSFARSLNRTKLWLNLETTDPMSVTYKDLQSSWKPLEHLLLISSTDAPPYECIRPRLSPYEKLLRELGCKSIHHPTVELPASKSAQSLLSGLRSCRKGNKMTDIIFVAENIRFHAHRIVLACASSYCEASLSGRWPIDQEITLDMSAHSLRILIDTAYEEPIDWAEMTVDPEESSQDLEANDKKLDLLLDLHKGADYWLMPSLANQVEIKILEQSRLFIRLDNVGGYQATAAESNARVFERVCRRFCEENEVALRGWENAVALQIMEDDAS